MKLDNNIDLKFPSANHVGFYGDALWNNEWLSACENKCDEVFKDPERAKNDLIPYDLDKMSIPMIAVDKTGRLFVDDTANGLFKADDYNLHLPLDNVVVRQYDFDLPITNKQTFGVQVVIVAFTLHSAFGMDPYDKFNEVMDESYMENYVGRKMLDDGTNWLFFMNSMILDDTGHVTARSLMSHNADFSKNENVYVSDNYVPTDYNMLGGDDTYVVARVNGFDSYGEPNIDVYRLMESGNYQHNEETDEDDPVLEPIHLTKCSKGPCVKEVWTSINDKV